MELVSVTQDSTWTHSETVRPATVVVCLVVVDSLLSVLLVEIMPSLSMVFAAAHKDSILIFLEIAKAATMDVSPVQVHQAIIV